MIHFGKEQDGRPLDVDLDALMRGRLLVTASSGGGKTATLLQLCERFAGKVQIIAIDPEGEFAVLRQKYPFILAGPDGETPAMVRTAALLAQRLLELGASAVLDIYELPMQEKHLFVRDFLAAMIDAPKRLWHPVIVIVDEAHMFAPEKGAGESVAIGAMADLASRGRKRGYCAVLATQRLAKLSKNVAAECQNVLIGRTTQIDQARAGDVLNLGKAERIEFGREIGRMPAGDFYAYGLAFHREAPTRFSVTKPETMPKAGAKRVHVPPPPEAIQALLPRLADLPAEAEAKAKTEKELHEEIRQLKALVKANARSIASNVQTISPAREKMLLETINTLEVNLAATKKKAGAFEFVMLKIAKRAGELEAIAVDIQASVEWVMKDTAKDAPQAPAPKSAPIRALTAEGHAQAPAVAGVHLTAKELNPESVSRDMANAPRLKPEGGDGKLSAPEQRILNSLAWLHAIGVDQPEHVPVAFMAGYSPTSTSYTNPRAKLNGAGLISMSNGRIWMTEGGKPYAVVPDIELTDEALQREVLSRIGGPEGRILKPLLKAYPKGLTNAEAAEAAGYSPTSTSYTNPRSRLRSLGLIRNEAGQLFAESLLFPEGK